MKELEDVIRARATVLGGHVLKADSFLNHQVDVVLMEKIGREFARHFDGKGINKVLTCEASGIAPAAFTALALAVPMVFARKSRSLTLTEDLLTTRVESYTKETTVNLTISRKYIRPEDTLLLIDDFLAKGEVVKGLLNLVQESGAAVAGIGIVVEKSFQPGRRFVDQTGIPLYSLARIASLTDGKIRFAE